MAKSTTTDTSSSKGMMSRLTLGTLVNNVNTHSAGGIIGSLISDWIAPFFLAAGITKAVKTSKGGK